MLKLKGTVRFMPCTGESARIAHKYRLIYIIAKEHLHE